MSTESQDTQKLEQQLNVATSTPAEDLPPTHLMIDIEMMGTSPDAVILSIGACSIFSPSEKRKTFYVEVNPRQKNRSVSVETVIWWMDQVAQSIDCPLRGEIELVDALDALNKFIDEQFASNPIVWCKGTDFDIVILYNAMMQLGLKPAWKYNDVRDWRTVKKLFPVNKNIYPGNPDPHNALSDALFQADELKKTAFEYGLQPR